MKQTILLVLTSLISVFAFSQTFEDAINNSLAKSRNGEYKYLVKDDFDKLEDVQSAVAILENNVQDSLAIVRRNCLWIAQRLTDFVNNKEDLKSLSNVISYGLNDVESGIVGSSIQYLTQFQRDEISDETRSKIGVLLQQRTPHYTDLIRLAGFHASDETVAVLKSLNASDSLTSRVKWNIRLAMIRAGDNTYENYVVNRIRRLPVNDDMVFGALPDLIYTRSPKGIAYLEELLLSDEKNCRPADMEVPGSITCAYRVMELIGPILNDFPYKIEDRQLDTDDYPAALNQVRSWVTGLNGNYDILSDTF